MPSEREGKRACVVNFDTRSEGSPVRRYKGVIRAREGKEMSGRGVSYRGVLARVDVDKMSIQREWLLMSEY